MAWNDPADPADDLAAPLNSNHPLSLTDNTPNKGNTDTTLNHAYQHVQINTAIRSLRNQISRGSGSYSTLLDRLNAVDLRTGSRATASVTTSSLATGAVANTTIGLAKSYRLLRITTSVPARVRLYATTAQRGASGESARAEGTDPTGNHGVVCDIVTDSGALTLDLSPIITGSSMETTPVTSIPCAITNKSNSTSAVTVTFVYQKLED